ncbi:patatin-like phospholipase family protein [Undibacterium arcticum]
MYEELSAQNTHIDWMVGTSIGAINGAIIAGNPPQHHVRKLREFWDLVGQTAPFLFFIRNVWRLFFRRLENSGRTMETVIKGIPGFFSRRATARSWISVRQFRLPMPAFSGALPPGFPPVEIDGRFYWDGGIVSNSPMDIVLDGATRRGPDQSKDIDFSITALAERWSAGQADIKRALHHKSWVKTLAPPLTSARFCTNSCMVKHRLCASASTPPQHRDAAKPSCGCVIRIAVTSARSRTAGCERRSLLSIG